MKIKLYAIAAALFIIAPAAHAQDLPTDQLMNHSQVVRQDSLTRSLLQQKQNNANGGQASGTALTPKAKATCENKEQAAKNFGKDHPKVRQLYALCAKAGY